VSTKKTIGNKNVPATGHALLGDDGNPFGLANVGGTIYSGVVPTDIENMGWLRETILGFTRDAELETLRDVWPGNEEGLTLPATAQQIIIDSTSGQDAVAGDGARRITIEGLDGDYRMQSEEVVMSGATDAHTINEYIRINKMYVSQAGTGLGHAEGDIISRYETGGVPRQLAVIPENHNTSASAIFTVPLGYTAIVTNWKAFTSIPNPMVDTWSALSVMLHLRSNYNNYSGLQLNTFKTYDLMGCTGFSQCQFSPSFLFPETSDIKVSVGSTVSIGTETAYTMTSVGLYLRPN